MITIVDYGMGNLRSVAKALEHLGASATLTSDPGEIARAEKLVLPGVGAFGAAMTELKRRQLVEPIRKAIGSGTPYLGICLGLQLLFESSEEAPGVAGLGLLAGTVKKFRDPSLKVPHMGWNQIARAKTAGLQDHLLEGIPDGSYCYFVHSYYAQPSDETLVTLRTAYGMPFASMVARERLFATQFHPEKSQAVGLRLLENFLTLA